VQQQVAGVAQARNESQAEQIEEGDLGRAVVSVVCSKIGS
jgi:hypothetical protein